MDEVSYEYRETIEDSKDGHKYKVTTVVRVQKKQVLTNSDIERRQQLKKFGNAAEYERGQNDKTITLDDKDIYLLPFGQEKNEDSIMKFVSTRTHRDKMDNLKRKEDQLKSGKSDESYNRRQVITESSSFQIKVTNIPLWLSTQELEEVFAIVTRPKKVYRPISKEDGKPRDFAILTYNSNADATAAIKRFDGRRCENQILGAEMAENKTSVGRGKMRK